MTFKQSQAIERAASWVGCSYPAGWCQTWVVTEVFASGGVGDYDGNGHPSAIDGWKAARLRLETTDPAAVPSGLPIYFLGGQDGHAAVSAGDGYMVSTDLPTRGRVGRVPIHLAEQRWGLRFVGAVLIDYYGHDFRDAQSASSPSKQGEDDMYSDTDRARDDLAAARIMGRFPQRMLPDGTPAWGLDALDGDVLRRLLVQDLEAAARLEAKVDALAHQMAGVDPAAITAAGDAAVSRVRDEIGKLQLHLTVGDAK